MNYRKITTHISARHLQKLAQKLALFLVFWGVMTLSAHAQNADEYFHRGAQSFIASNLSAAINEVREGLAQYPNDPKLNALMQKLQEEQERQQQQQQQEQNQSQDQEQNQDQQQQEQDQQQQQDQQNEQDQQGEGDNQQEQNPQEGSEESNPQQMSKEDAEKILQALAQKEKELLKEFKKQKSDGSKRHEKDW